MQPSTYFQGSNVIWPSQSTVAWQPGLKPRWTVWVLLLMMPRAELSGMLDTKNHLQSECSDTDCLPT